MSHITSTERFAKAGPYTYTYPMKNTLIGYARCSTDKQDLSAQGQALFNLGVSEDNIYTDHGLTGTSRDRPGLDQAIAAVREGDTLVVPKLDRLARSVPDARAIAEQLEVKGVKLALGASVYDPTDPMGKMFFNILATFAEFESDLIRMRTREGMAIARAKGKLRGKQPKLTEKQQKELGRMHATGEYSISDLAELFTASRPTVYRTLNRLYHRAECLTHVGDSQAVRSLTQCGEPMRFAMAAPIDLRNDFDSVSLRRLAKRTRDATQSRRLLALAEVYDGGSRTDASRIGGVGLQIIRDWVLRFNARGPDGLVDGKSPGAPSKLNADHRRALAEVVEAGPVPAVDGVVRWRRKDLARWLLETFAISLDETTVGRELKALGFAKISARPRHYAQNELAVEAFKKNFPAELAKIRARLPKGVEIELWWQDEARIGQKNKLTRRWARRGTRPRAPRDQRTEWAYIFGAICPAKGKGAGLVMPWCDTDAMAAHLIEISAAVDPGAHAVLIVDQAGWHLTPKLAIPDNITVLALPPRSPELNPVENVWQFMRDNWLSNRIFKSYEDIVALCCQAWNNLIDQPWKIMSLGMRKWAHGF